MEVQRAENNTNVHRYSKSLTEKPFFELTLEMLDCVRDHNFDRLSKICDDDYGIIDINTDGSSKIIRDRKGWEDWFNGLFARLESMNAETWSEITGYEVVTGDDMAYSVVDFDQFLVVNDQKMRFSVIATIIWKKNSKGDWREGRYHSSLVDQQVF